MSELHPLWQATDGDPVTVRVKEAAVPKEIPIEGQSVSVSRKPAAIVGMLGVLTIGILLFQGLDGMFAAQVTNTPHRKTVTISENGFSPAVIQVEHGETIVWVNNDKATHGILSSTLCSNTGFCLQTAPLANGGQGTFTITPDIPAGSYEYASTTDPSMKGSIQIITTAAQNFADIPAPSENTGGIPTNPNTVSGQTGYEGTIFDPSVNPFDSQNTVPENPYALGSTREHPFDENGKPVDSLFDTQATQAQAMLQKTKPVRQPTTGAETWVVILASICVLYWTVKGKLQAVSVIRA